MRDLSRIIAMVLLVFIFVSFVGVDCALAQEIYNLSGQFNGDNDSQTIRNLGVSALIFLGVWGIYRRSRSKRKAEYRSNLEQGQYFLERGDYRLAIYRFEAARKIKDTNEALRLLDEARDKYQKSRQKIEDQRFKDINNEGESEDLSSNKPIESGDSKVVEVKGISYIAGRDIARAKSLAINDGLRRGVEKVVGLHINAQTKVENYELISDSILRSSEGYVKNYQIVDEYNDGDNYYVYLRVEVGVGELEDDLEALKLNIKRQGNPRLMVVASQRANFTNLSNSIIENEFIKILLESGYQVVDSTEVKNVVKKEQEEAMVRGDYQLASQLGKQLNAEVVLIADGVASKVDLRGINNNSLSGLVSYSGQVEVRAIDTSNARVIGVSTGRGEGIGISRQDAASKALLAASKDSGEEIVSSISNVILSSEKNIRLQIREVESLAQLGTIRRELPSISQLDNVYFREYSNNLAIFDLELMSGSDPLDFALDLEDLLPFKFKVVSLSDGKLILELIE
ncbi:LPP20 family lipoprotein [Halonatronum saccharophilum]|uniref:LPP20 family lipoprotein n=1 Tax=Halonatronum saccharophilum TaxID=150060 RepID=UPI0004879591|nr:LPP20 family lipoprotein [Halonatronum saccharophilum]